MAVVSNPKEIRSSFYETNEMEIISFLTVSVVSFCSLSFVFFAVRFVVDNGVFPRGVGEGVHHQTVYRQLTLKYWKRFLMCFSAHGHPQDRYFLNIANWTIGVVSPERAGAVALAFHRTVALWALSLIPWMFDLFVFP